MDRERAKRFCWAMLSSLLLTTIVCAQNQSAVTAPSGEPLTLKIAVELALRNSRSLAVARLQQGLAEKTALISQAEFLPNIYAGSGVAYSHGIPEGPGGHAPSIFNVSYTQQLFNQPLRGQLRELRERTNARVFETEKIRETVIVATASAYLELSKVRNSIDLLGKERQSAKRILDVTTQRLSEGLELPIESTKAQLAAARIEQRIVDLEGREEDLQSTLRDLTGLPPDHTIEVRGEDLPESASVIPTNATGQALANNVLMKQAESEMRARELRLKGERGGRYPTVEMVGIYSLLSRFNNYDVFYRRFQRNNFNFGVQVQMPIFSMRTKAAIALATTDLKVAEMNVEQTRSTLSASIRKQSRRTRVLDSAREVARLELQLAQQGLGNLQAQYQEGRISLRDLEKQRLEESDRWLDFLNANFDRQQAQLELLRTTGQLAQIFQ
ncbi:MAG TPA: TolC family protein [Candidatus Dormibacteraeota bacterium]|nr:TolC family protein [Candidatus Dormibacteraeota bacterium]